MMKLKVTRRQLLGRAFAINTFVIAGLLLAPGCRPAVQAQVQQPAAPVTVPAAPTTNQIVPQNFEPIPKGQGYAGEINEFLEADKKQMPPQNAVLFMGSSTIKIWDTLSKDFSEIPVINRGFGGSFIQDSTKYADRIAFPYNPKIIVLCAGTNDLDYGNKNPQQVFDDYKAFVAKIHGTLPNTRIVFLSVNPTVSRWKHEANILETNYLIERYNFENNSPTEKLNFINSHSQILTADNQPQPKLLRADGLHFNADGYRLFTSIIKPRILALADMDGVQRLPTAK